MSRKSVTAFVYARPAFMYRAKEQREYLREAVTGFLGIIMADGDVWNTMERNHGFMNKALIILIQNMDEKQLKAAAAEAVESILRGTKPARAMRELELITSEARTRYLEKENITEFNKEHHRAERNAESHPVLDTQKTGSGSFNAAEFDALNAEEG